MRVRSVITVLGASIALAGALVRCTLPELPPPPGAFSSRVKEARGMLVSLPAEKTDHAALLASLRRIGATTIIIDASADSTGEAVADRVALAVELQREVALRDSEILIGTYRARAYEGKPMAALLQPDAAFTSCYPGGPVLDPGAAIIDKLRVCSQAVSQRIADALAASGATAQIGCYITHEPELTDALTDEGRAKLTALLHDSAAACSATNRKVAYSTLITPQSGDPGLAARLLRDVLPGTGVNHVLVRDGVATSPDAGPFRAANYYLALRTATVDRPPVVNVWADVESFDCETAACDRTHPTNTDRFRKQLCGAQNRVELIVTREFLRDFAVSDAGGDAGVTDVDILAAGELTKSYIAWSDGGPPSCQ